MAVIPQTDVGFLLDTDRSWTKSFAYVDAATQQIHRDLTAYVENGGKAQLRRRRGDAGDPILDFTVEVVIDPAIDDDRSDPASIKDRVDVSVTVDDTADLVAMVGWFDCFVAHSDGVSTLTMCPPVPMTVQSSVSR